MIRIIGGTSDMSYLAFDKKLSFKQLKSLSFSLRSPAFSKQGLVFLEIVFEQFSNSTLIHPQG